MAELKVIEKPESVSYDVIRGVLQEAHRENIARGIVSRTVTYSADDLAGRVLSRDEKTFVAMDGDKVVGTLSCRKAQRKKWYHKGPVILMQMLGVLPDYQGRGIMTGLVEAVVREARESGLNVIYIDVAERNTKMLRAAGKRGFVPVELTAPHSPHYCIVMLKWLDGCPFSSVKILWNYRKSRIRTKLKFKPGRIRRFPGRTKQLPVKTSEAGDKDE